MASVNDIRRAFLDFFKKNGHEVVPSSPLVPRNDPTLMFTNAGMVQFKNVFTGQETRPYVRAAILAEVRARRRQAQRPRQRRLYGAPPHLLRDARQLLVRRLLQGAQAIPLAWELLTKDYGLDTKRLTITVYHDDDEAHAIWKKLTGFGDDKIIRIATSDNFWQMGDTGPCGPCSEIFFDHGDKISGGPPGSAGCRRRPLRRDLEPRVHAVRAARPRRAHRPAQAVGRYRHGPRTHRRRAAGRRTTTTTSTCSRR